MASENNFKHSFLQKLPFGNGLAQLLTLIGIQVINVFKAIQLSFEKVTFERLAAIAGPLSKVSTVFLGIAVLIENILNVKNLWEMSDDVDEAQKTKTRLDAVLGFLKAAVVGIFTAVTFGVTGAFLVAAALALPILVGIDCLFDAGKIVYDSYTLKRKQKENAPEFQGPEGEIKLKAAKENLQNAKSILWAKGVVLAGAIMTLFPFPLTIVGGYTLVGIGFAGIVKKAFDGQEIEAKKEAALAALKQTEEPKLLINEDERNEYDSVKVSASSQPLPQKEIIPQVERSQEESFDFSANSFYSFFSAVGGRMQLFAAEIADNMPSLPSLPRFTSTSKTL